MPTLKVAIDARGAQVGAQEVKRNLESIKKSSAETGSEVDKLDKQIRQVGNAAKSTASGADTLDSGVRKVGKTSKNTQAEVKALEAEMRKLFVASGTVFERFDRKLAGNNTDAISQIRSKAAALLSYANDPTSGASGSAASLAGKVLGATSREYDKFGAIKGVIGGVKDQFLGLAGAIGLTYSAIQSVQAYGEYDQVMKEIQVVTKATASEMDGLRNQAKKLSSESRFTAAEVGQSTLALIKGGMTIQQGQAAAPSALNLSVVGGVDTDHSAEIISNTLAQFNLSADKSSEVADTLSVVADKAATDVVDLAEAMKYAGSISGSLNQNLQVITGALGQLSNAGIKGSAGGTALRGILSALVKPTNLAKQEIEGLGLTIAELDPSKFSLIEILEKLKQKNLSVASSVKIFGIESAGAAVNLARNIDSVKELSGAYSENQGYAENLARAYDDTIPGAVKKLLSSINLLIISAGESGLGNAFKSSIVFAGDLIKYLAGIETAGGSLNGVIKVIGSAIKGLAVAIAAFLALQAASYIISLGSAFTGIIPAIKAAGVAMYTFGGPIGIIAAAIGALTAAYLYFKDTNIQLGDSVVQLGDIVSAIVDVVLNRVSKVFTEVLPQAFSAFWNYATSLFQKGTQYIVDTFNTLFGTTGTSWSEWGGFLVDATKDVVNTIIGVLLAMSDTITAIFNGIVEVVKRLIGFVVDSVMRIPAMLEVIQNTDWLSTDSISASISKLGDISKAQLNSVGNLAKDLKNIAVNSAGEIADAWKGRLNEDFVAEIGDFAVTQYKTVVTSIKSFIDDSPIIKGAFLTLKSEWDKALDEITANAKKRAAARNGETNGKKLDGPKDQVKEIVGDATNDGADDVKKKIADARADLDTLFNGLTEEQKLYGTAISKNEVILDNQRERAQDIARLRDLAAKGELKNIDDIVDRYKSELDVVRKLKAEYELMQEMRNIDRQRASILSSGNSTGIQDKIAEERDKLIQAGFSADETARKIDTLTQKLKDLDKASELRKVGNDIGESFANSFKDISFGAKSASDAMKDFGRQVLDTLYQAIVAKQMAAAISDVVVGIGGFFGAAGGTTAKPAANGTVFAFANGGIMGGESPLAGLAAILPTSGGKVRTYDADGNLVGHESFSSASVDRPTLFKTRSGMGLMGEAGKEYVARVGMSSLGMTAIGSDGKQHSLTRGLDGRLGFRAYANGGVLGTTPSTLPTQQRKHGDAPTVNFNITTPDVNGFKRSERQIAARMKKVWQ